MTFLAPGFLIAAAAAAAAIVALHFLSTREPKLELLPTTRFLPDLPVRATATTLRPTDPWLLLLRVLLVLLTGAALARPVLTPPRQPVARIVAVDVSRAVGNPAELVDTLSAYLPAAAVIAFDSAAVELTSGALGGEGQAAGAALRTMLDARGDGSRGSHSAAFVAARRAAARIRDRADSLELVVISPFAFEGYDAATASIRALWPGRVTTVLVAAAPTDMPRDSVLVEWADSATGGSWVAREAVDTMAAVRAGDAVLIHPFARRWRLAETAAAGGRVFARWADGEPAGIERGHMDADASGTVCVRSIGFSLPDEGDVVLRPSFERFLDGLAEPCGDPRDFTPLPATVMAMFEGDGPLAATAAIDRRIQRATPLTPWLLLAGALLALAELFVRRRGSRSAAVEADAADTDSTARAA